ncbi:DUF1844 domain-containing protein [bacterium]|nr:MAG: DUF1844 domain-containing protein [bacterium]
MGDANDKKTPGVYEYIFSAFQQMTEISWSKLGLTPDIISGQVEENLGEAKVAIDLTAHLASVLEPQLDEEDRRRVQGIVRDLRVNFVNRQ